LLWRKAIDAAAERRVAAASAEVHAADVAATRAVGNLEQATLRDRVMALAAARSARVAA
jgi:hypothetical protein